MKMIIIKLGGSIITNKEKYCTPDMNNINRICNEITEAVQNNKGTRLIIIVGGGSYGHQVSYNHTLHEGYKNNDQLHSMLLMTSKMWQIGNLISETLGSNGIPTFNFHSPSFIIANDSRIEDAFCESIKSSIDLGLVPILWGDVIFDRIKKFTVISGDIIAVYLAKILNVDRVMMFSNVDGVISNFGEENQALIKKIDKTNYEKVLDEIKESNIIDISGGMGGKLRNLFSLSEYKIQSFIGNGNKKNLIFNALNGNEVEGTYIN